MTLISGYIGITQQASQVLFLNIFNFTFTFAQGFATAVSASIGQQIGKGDVEKAK
jgi:Na+-driven multidrug efflux pump